MCGITAIYSYHYASLPVDREELVRMHDYLKDRGPDAAGVWFSPDQQVGLAHRRLSIIDLSNQANQPMRTTNNELVITYNGEIYNFKELRSQLESKGYQFQTASDTEVLLYLYQEKKEKMVHDLRGMFAFAIWDQRNKTMFLARDPYGIKPLYYADDGWTARVASQVKALLASEKISQDIDPAGCAGFYLLGSVPEPYSLYRNIRALPAGSYCWINQLGVNQPISYFSLANVYCEAEKIGLTKSKPAQLQFLRESLKESVRAHLVADVPIGVFLSAGLDSATLVGLMKDAGQQQIKTVTLKFSEFEGMTEEESVLASKIARYYGTDHVTRHVNFAEFKQDWPLILKKMDQPTIDGINTWFVSKATRELGLNVAMSGIGGDELFGGYPSFARIPQLVKISQIPSRIPFFSKGFSCLINFMLRMGLPLHPKTAALFKNTSSYMGSYLLFRGLFLPEEIKKIVKNDFLLEGLQEIIPFLYKQYLQAKPKNTFSKIAILESNLYMRNQLLRDTDWASMSHGVEVRTPFVDSVLVKQVAPIMIHGGIRSKQAILENMPEKNLPRFITERKKTGFHIPLGHWLQTLNAVSDKKNRSAQTVSRSLALHMMQYF